MYTDHELISMTQQYTRTRQGRYICHIAYEEINNQVKEGRQWAKCNDCGNPFPLDSIEAVGVNFCSMKCESNTMKYLLEGDF